MTEPTFSHPEKFTAVNLRNIAKDIDNAFAWATSPQGREYWAGVKVNLNAIAYEIEDQETSPEAALKALENCECEKAKEILRKLVNK